MPKNFGGLKKKSYLCTRNQERCTLKQITRLQKAEIAQLVEHNLAKVGVAGPSPVFRSIIFVLNQDRFKFRAQVAELVDAHVSGACVSQRAGSSPVLGTMFKLA